MEFIERYVQKELEKVLHEYFFDFSPIVGPEEQLIGSVEWRDLRLRPGALQALDIPLIVDQGAIKCIRTNIPFKALFGPVEVSNPFFEVEGVTLVLVPSTAKNEGTSILHERRETFKALRLVLSEIVYNVLRATLEGYGLWDLFVNTTVSIEDVLITYHDSRENFELELKFERLDSFFPSPEDIPSGHPVRGVSNYELLDFAIIHSMSGVKSEIVPPISAIMTLLDKKMFFGEQVGSTAKGTEFSLVCTLTSRFNITLNKFQVGHLESFSSTISRRLFGRTRSRDVNLQELRWWPVRGSAKSYWQHVIAAMLPEIIKRVAKKMDLPVKQEWTKVYGLLRPSEDRERYISLYTRSLNVVGYSPLTFADVSEQIGLEQRHAVETIILWRVEAKLRLMAECPDGVVKARKDFVMVNEEIGGILKVLGPQPDADEKMALSAEDKRKVLRSALDYLSRTKAGHAAFSISLVTGEKMADTLRFWSKQTWITLIFERILMKVEFSAEHFNVEFVGKGCTEAHKPSVEPRIMGQNKTGKVHIKFHKKKTGEGEPQPLTVQLFFRQVDIVNCQYFANFFMDLISIPVHRVKRRMRGGGVCFDMVFSDSTLRFNLSPILICEGDQGSMPSLEEDLSVGQHHLQDCIRLELGNIERQETEEAKDSNLEIRWVHFPKKKSRGRLMVNGVRAFWDSMESKIVEEFDELVSKPLNRSSYAFIPLINHWMIDLSTEITTSIREDYLVGDEQETSSRRVENAVSTLHAHIDESKILVTQSILDHLILMDQQREKRLQERQIRKKNTIDLVDLGLETEELEMEKTPFSYGMNLQRFSAHLQADDVSLVPTTEEAKDRLQPAMIVLDLANVKAKTFQTVTRHFKHKVFAEEERFDRYALQRKETAEEFETFMAYDYQEEEVDISLHAFLDWLVPEETEIPGQKRMKKKTDSASLWFYAVERVRDVLNVYTHNHRKVRVAISNTAFFDIHRMFGDRKRGMESSQVRVILPLPIFNVAHNLASQALRQNSYKMEDELQVAMGEDGEVGDLFSREEDNTVEFFNLAWDEFDLYNIDLGNDPERRRAGRERSLGLRMKSPTEFIEIPELPDTHICFNVYHFLVSFKSGGEHFFQVRLKEMHGTVDHKPGRQLTMKFGETSMGFGVLVQLLRNYRLQVNPFHSVFDLFFFMQKYLVLQMCQDIAKLKQGLPLETEQDAFTRFRHSRSNVVAHVSNVKYSSSSAESVELSTRIVVTFPHIGFSRLYELDPDNPLLILHGIVHMNVHKFNVDVKVVEFEILHCSEKSTRSKQPLTQNLPPLPSISQTASPRILQFGDLSWFVMVQVLEPITFNVSAVRHASGLFPLSSTFEVVDAEVPVKLPGTCLEMCFNLPESVRVLGSSRDVHFMTVLWKELQRAGQHQWQQLKFVTCNETTWNIDLDKLEFLLLDEHSEQSGKNPVLVIDFKDLRFFADSFGSRNRVKVQTDAFVLFQCPSPDEILSNLLGATVPTPLFEPMAVNTVISSEKNPNKTKPGVWTGDFQIGRVDLNPGEVRKEENITMLSTNEFFNKVLERFSTVWAKRVPKETELECEFEQNVLERLSILWATRLLAPKFLHVRPPEPVRVCDRAMQNETDSLLFFNHEFVRESVEKPVPVRVEVDGGWLPVVETVSQENSRTTHILENMAGSLRVGLICETELKPVLGYNAVPSLILRVHSNVKVVNDSAFSVFVHSVKEPLKSNQETWLPLMASATCVLSIRPSEEYVWGTVDFDPLNAMEKRGVQGDFIPAVCTHTATKQQWCYAVEMRYDYEALVTELHIHATIVFKNFLPCQLGIHIFFPQIAERKEIEIEGLETKEEEGEEGEGGEDGGEEITIEPFGEATFFECLASDPVEVSIELADTTWCRTDGLHASERINLTLPNAGAPRPFRNYFFMTGAHQRLRVFIDSFAITSKTENLFDVKPAVQRIVHFYPEHLFLDWTNLQLHVSDDQHQRGYGHPASPDRYTGHAQYIPFSFKLLQKEKEISLTSPKCPSWSAPLDIAKIEDEVRESKNPEDTVFRLVKVPATLQYPSPCRSDEEETAEPLRVESEMFWCEVVVTLSNLCNVLKNEAQKLPPHFPPTSVVSIAPRLQIVNHLSCAISVRQHFENKSAHFEPKGFPIFIPAGQAVPFHFHDPFLVEDRDKGRQPLPPLCIVPEFEHTGFEDFSRWEWTDPIPVEDPKRFAVNFHNTNLSRCLMSTVEVLVNGEMHCIVISPQEHAITPVKLINQSNIVSIQVSQNMFPRPRNLLLSSYWMSVVPNSEVVSYCWSDPLIWEQETLGERMYRQQPLALSLRLFAPTNTFETDLVVDAVRAGAGRRVRLPEPTPDVYIQTQLDKNTNSVIVNVSDIGKDAQLPGPISEDALWQMAATQSVSSLELIPKQIKQLYTKPGRIPPNTSGSVFFEKKKYRRIALRVLEIEGITLPLPQSRQMIAVVLFGNCVRKVVISKLPRRNADKLDLEEIFVELANNWVDLPAGCLDELLCPSAIYIDLYERSKERETSLFYTATIRNVHRLIEQSEPSPAVVRCDLHHAEVQDITTRKPGTMNSLSREGCSIVVELSSCTRLLAVPRPN